MVIGICGGKIVLSRPTHGQTSPPRWSVSLNLFFLPAFFEGRISLLRDTKTPPPVRLALFVHGGVSAHAFGIIDSGEHAQNFI